MTDKPSTALATTGSTRQRLYSAVIFSETNRKKAKQIRANVRRRKLPQIQASLRRIEMRAPTEAEVDSLLDRTVSEDPDYKSAVGDENFGGRLSMQYALLVLVEQMDRQDEVLRGILNELKRLARE